MAPLEGKPGGSFRLQPGCSDPGWRYSRVPPCEASPGSSSTQAPPRSGEGLTREHTSTASSSCASHVALLRQRSRSHGEGWGGQAAKLGWAGPALLLLGSLFLQSAGLYAATGSYVRWMDELSEAAMQSESTGDFAQAFVLDDPLSGWLAKLGSLEALEVPWLAETWIDVATGLLAVAWLCWVVRMQDLSLWTRSMFSGAILAVLKGLLAWATVLPDPAGWQGCQERLGEDGVAYFRQAGSGDAAVGFGQALLDILLLELRGLWVLDRSGHRRVCADTVFSGQASFCLILSAGLYDVVRAATQGLQASRRLALRGLALLLLGLLVLASLARAVAGGPRHYAADALLAAALAPLAHGSPAVALAARRWERGWALGPGLLDEGELPASPRRQERAGPLDGHLREPDHLEPDLQDLGECGLPPCCSAPGGGAVCHLRADPGEPGLLPWTEESEKRHQHQLAEFREILAREADRRHQAEQEIAREHEGVREHSRQVEERHEQRLEAELKRMESLELKALQRARRELEAARATASKMQERVAAEARRFSRVEADFKMCSSQLSGAAKKHRRHASEARAACSKQEQSIRESEQQLEALQKFLFRHADPVATCDAGCSRGAGEEPCEEPGEEPAGPESPGNDAKEASA